MSQYGSNKTATAILLDTSRGMDLITSNGQSFFQRSKGIISRILLRKMFAYEVDEVGLMAFGPAGIDVVFPCKLSSWESLRLSDDLTISSEVSAGNWANGLVRAVDFMEEQCTGKKFKDKQLVVLSNFTWSSSNASDKLNILATAVNGRGIKVIVIGHDIKKESQEENGISSGLGQLLEFISLLDTGISLGFEEAEEDMKLYEKKKKAKRLMKGVMRIGSEISVPLRWMKVTTEDTRLLFDSPNNKFHMLRTEDNAVKRTDSEDTNQSPLKKTKNDPCIKLDNIPEVKFEQDESKKTRFGATEVLLSYADLEAMKRQTGPPSLTLLGTVKSSKISRAMIISPDVYVMVADATKKSQAMLSALVTALLDENKYGLARRVATKNGKVNIGILYPVSDDLGKALYFLKVPVADWIKSVPYRPLPDIVEPALSDLMSELIDEMSISGQGRDLLVNDPNFQLRCTRVELRARQPDNEEIPDHVLQLFDPHPELRKSGEPVVQKILDLYPIPPPPPMSNPEDTVIEGKKELTDEQRKEVQKITDFIKTDPDSLQLYGEMMGKDVICSERMDTEDVLNMIPSQM